MTITGKNPTIRLSIIRSQIDKQQQVIALLENKLQETILGGTDTGSVYEDLTLDGVLEQISNIYGDQKTVSYKTALAFDPDDAPAVNNIVFLTRDNAGAPQFNKYAASDIYNTNGTPKPPFDSSNFFNNVIDGPYYIGGATGTAVDQALASELSSYNAGNGFQNLSPVDIVPETIPENGNILTGLPVIDAGVNRSGQAILIPVVVLEEQPTYTGLTGAVHKGVTDFQQVDTNGNPLALEQDAIRQLLYQARALMGELRVEEQHWNTEVSQEKDRRKDLQDFSKA